MTEYPKTSLTNLYISKATRDRIKALGKKGETYEQVLERLLNRVERKTKGDS